MIAIIDYGVGNLFSLSSSVAAVGAESVITGDAEVIRRADKLILPGVGAFGDAVRKLRDSGLFDVVREEALSGKPLLGICLGMQLLFDESHEYGVHRGLGLIKGKVVPIKGAVPDNYKIPHIGWNGLSFKKDCPIMKYLREGEHVYFVHSYYAEVEDDSLVATAEYGAELTAAVAKGNIYGCQFHPEKSGESGLSILRAFCEI